MLLTPLIALSDQISDIKWLVKTLFSALRGTCGLIRRGTKLEVDVDVLDRHTDRMSSLEGLAASSENLRNIEGICTPPGLEDKRVPTTIIIVMSETSFNQTSSSRIP